MASAAPMPDARTIPMTYERALTAVTQARALVVRAHREVAEAFEIMASRQGNGWPLNEAAQRAAGLLHLASTLKRLDGVRSELLAAAAAGSTANPTVRPHRSRRQNEPLFEGEFPPIEERLVVSPGWGRLHQRRLRQGRWIERETVIAELRSERGKVLIRAPVSATFSSWLVPEGSVVAEGWALARFQRADPAEGPG